MITVFYHSIDGVRKAYTYGKLEHARVKAQYWVGQYPTLSKACGYAVSDDGIGKITCEGCSIADLFPGAE